MSYCIRPMRAEDIPQALEIEREAFSTQWPPPSFKKDLENRLCHYLVVYEKPDGDDEKTLEVNAEKPDRAEPGGLRGLISRLRHLFARERFFSTEAPAGRSQYILGMAGFWFMFDEAHLTTIAVREKWRRRGLGELLLISAIDLAIRLNAQVVTLEVRASNHQAQALYEKYGFRKTGVRPHYYTDNREDALIMTTDRITSASFQAQFQRLKHAHAQRWREVEYRIA